MFLPIESEPPATNRIARPPGCGISEAEQAGTRGNGVRAIVALDPNNVDARGNLGVILFFQGAYADAIPQLRDALKPKLTLWKIQALFGIAEKRAGDIEAGRHDLEEAFPKVQQEERIRI